MLGLYSPIMASTESMISDSAFPDFPAENPDKHELKEWLDAFKDALNTAGFGLTLRGEPPRECANKIDRIPGFRPVLGTFDPHPATPGLVRRSRTNSGYAGAAPATSDQQ